MVSVGLDNGVNNFLVSQDINGASVLVPSVGDFSAIQEYIRSIFVDGFIRSEAATVTVLNGSGIANVATEKTAELQSFGYNVVLTDVAPTSDYSETVMFNLSDGSKSFTKQLLENRFGSEMRSASFLPQDIASDSDFVIILGSNEAEVSE